MTEHRPVKYDVQVDSELVRIADVFSSLDLKRPDFELDALRDLVADLSARFKAFASDPSAFTHRTKEGVLVKDPSGYRIYADLAGLLNTTLINLRKIQNDSQRVREAITGSLVSYGQQAYAGIWDDVRVWSEILTRIETQVANAVAHGQGLSPRQTAQLRSDLAVLKEKLGNAKLSWRNLFVAAYDHGIKHAFSALPSD